MKQVIKKKFTVYFFLGFAVAAGMVWFSVFELEASRGLLLVSFFDVGQGDAIFVVAPNGNQVLIDGGPDNSILAKIGGVMPFWDRSIDLLVLTHPHADHLDGLVEVVRRYDIGLVVESGVNHSIPEYEEWHRLLKGKNVPVIIARLGQRIWISDSAYFEVLAPFQYFEDASPKNVHDAMVVSKLVYASTTALFMGDAEKSLERYLLFSGGDIDADILKVGHHGSKTSTSEEFLSVASPEIAVISAGKKNRYGHPRQEVLDRIIRSGIKVFRTDRDGDIIFLSDGVRFVRVE